MQVGLFPVQLVNEEPTSGTKHNPPIGWDASGTKYVIKCNKQHKHLALIEWLSYQLCRACGIPTPVFEIIRRVDGSIAFGIRWEDDAEQINEHMQHAVSLNLLAVHHAAISSTLALDGFLPNIDRNAGNFLFVRRSGATICLSIDYSMSGPRMYEPPKTPFGTWPMPPGTTTFKLYPHLPGGKALTTSTDRVNAALKAITKNQFQATLESAPEEWFEDLPLQDLLDWWDNEATTRLQI